MHDIIACIIILAHKLCILYVFTNLFTGYGNNRVCHIRLVQAIETVHVLSDDAALLLVVHILQHGSIDFPYVAPLLNFHT